MNQLSKLLIIIGAAGVISLLHAMTKNDTWLPNSDINAVQVNYNKTAKDERNQRHNESQQINALINTGDSYAGASVTHTNIVNNIYQADTGSFYLELEAEYLQEQAEQPPQSYVQAPLLKSDFNVSVAGNIVRTKVTQRFSNDSAQWQNGVYVFPLPEDAAVDAMLMQIGERIIEGEIQQKQQAEAAFKVAKKQGKSASLVSQLRPNMFVNRIANIAPNTVIEVTIEYQQILEVEQLTSQNTHQLNQQAPHPVQEQRPPHHGTINQYNIRIPSAITPRYSPREKSATASENHLSMRPYSELSINIEIDMGVALANIDSQHHQVRIEPPTDAEQKYRIYLLPEDAVSKEFVLQWQIKKQDRPVAAHFTQTSGNFQYGLIQIVPPTGDAVTINRDLTLVLDTSGSMVGDAIEQAKLALLTAISDLTLSDSFNIIEFNSTARKLWPSGRSANENNKAIARRFVEQLHASGGTEIADALDLAFTINNRDESSPANTDALQQILFITDGSVNNEAELLSLISNNLQEQRLFTVGIGSAPNTYFMSEAAIAGRGTFTLIGDISQVNNKMSALLRKIKRPALTDIHIVLNDGVVASDFEIYPRKVPDVYMGEPITLAYRVGQSTSGLSPADFTLQAQWHSAANGASDEPMLWQSQLPQQQLNARAGIAKHWASQKIQQLRRAFHVSDATGEDYLAMQQFTEKTITETALQHNLVSEHTSLIAIDHQQSRPSEEYMAMLAHKKRVNALTNKQWSVTQMQLPQTSTMSMQYLFWGTGLTAFALLILIVCVRK